MKKMIKLIALVFVFSAASLNASANETNTTTDPQERIEQLEDRVHEIWKMDFSEMENAVFTWT